MKLETTAAWTEQTRVGDGGFPREVSAMSSQSSLVTGKVSMLTAQVQQGGLWEPNCIELGSPLNGWCRSSKNQHKSKWQLLSHTRIWSRRCSGNDLIRSFLASMGGT